MSASPLRPKRQARPTLCSFFDLTRVLDDKSENLYRKMQENVGKYMKIQENHRKIRGKYKKIIGKSQENIGKSQENHRNRQESHHFICVFEMMFLPFFLNLQSRRYGQREDETEWLETGVFADVSEGTFWFPLNFGSVSLIFKLEKA